MTTDSQHTTSGTRYAQFSSSDGHSRPGCDERAELEAELDGLRRRVQSLPVIEQSKGLLIGYYSIDADTAFAVLRRWSQHTNIKLRLVSSALVDAANNPEPGESAHEALRHVIQCLQEAGPNPAMARDGQES